MHGGPPVAAGPARPNARPPLPPMFPLNPSSHDDKRQQNPHQHLFSEGRLSFQERGSGGAAGCFQSWPTRETPERWEGTRGGLTNGLQRDWHLTCCEPEGGREGLPPPGGFCSHRLAAAAGKSGKCAGVRRGASVTAWRTVRQVRVAGKPLTLLACKLSSGRSGRREGREALADATQNAPMHWRMTLPGTAPYLGQTSMARGMEGGHLHGRAAWKLRRPSVADCLTAPKGVNHPAQPWAWEAWAEPLPARHSPGDPA